MDRPVCTISTEEYQANMEWAAKSYHAARTGKTVPCRGCQKEFHLVRMFRCFYCGSYFCPACAREHFGERPGIHQFNLPAPEVELICPDQECESRDICPHAEAHEPNSECFYICGAGEPCSRCIPVEDFNG